MSSTSSLSPRAASVLALSCLLLGGVVFNAVSALADGLNDTQTVIGSNLIMPYDGYMMVDSAPITGTRTIQFDLYEASSGGTSVWVEEQAVQLYNGRFSVGLGTSTSLTARILDAEKLWLAMTIVEVDAAGTRSTIALSGRQAIEPAPFAAWSAYSADKEIAGDATVGGTLHVDGATTLGNATTDVHTITGDVNLNGPLKPGYSNWDSTSGDGGAVIRNDNGTYDALMIAGNTAGGGDRAIRLYDDVTIDDDLMIEDSMLVKGNTVFGNASTDSTTINGSATVTGTLSADTLSGAYRPVYDNWNSTTGDGGAGIFNDSSSFKALMIVGNDSDGDGSGDSGGVQGRDRRIEMYDDVNITDDLTVEGDLTVTGDITNLTVSGVYSLDENSASQDVDMVTTGNSICFLTRFRTRGHNEASDEADCIIDVSGANWQLRRANNGSGTPRCQARCLSW